MIVGVGDKRQAFTHFVLRELECTRTDGFFERGVILAPVLPVVVNMLRQNIAGIPAKVGDKAHIDDIHVEHGGMIIHCLNAVDFCHRCTERVGGIGLDRLKGVLDIGGSNGLAVMPLGIFLEMEGQVITVIGVLPGFGKIRNDVAVGVQLDKLVVHVFRCVIQVIVGENVRVEGHNVAIDLSNNSAARLGAVAIVASAVSGGILLTATGQKSQKCCCCENQSK